MCDLLIFWPLNGSNLMFPVATLYVYLFTFLMLFHTFYSFVRISKNLSTCSQFFLCCWFGK